MVRKLAGGFGFLEGPVFSRLGYLLFCDLAAQRILKWEAGAAGVFRDQSNAASGLTFDHQGRLLACERGRVTRTERDGRITALAGGMKRPNDVVYAIDGSIYFTDPPLLYQVTRTGEVRVAARDSRLPNGVALAPNQQKLYVADTAARRIRLYDIAPDGALRNGREFAEAEADGLKTDEEGKVWTTDGQAISVFDAGGRRIQRFEMPEMPTNLSWGEGFRNLYVTARTALYHMETKAHGTRTY